VRDRFVGQLVGFKLSNEDTDLKTREWVLRAPKADEVIGRLLQAVCAAQFASHDAVVQSQRVYTHFPHAGWGMDAKLDQADELVARLAKRYLLAALAPRPGKVEDEQAGSDAADPTSREDAAAHSASKDVDDAAA